MKAVLRARLGAAAIMARLRESLGEEAVAVEGDDAFAAAISSAELLLIPDSFYSAAVARMVRDGAPRLKWIQLLSAGYDAIASHGIPPGIILTNAGDAYAVPVATQAVALLLAIERQFPALLADQKRHAWDQSGARARCTVPFGSTVAVLGFGHIGSEIGRMLKAFGARIIAVTRSGKPHPDADEAVAATALPQLLPRVDALIIALAASPETRHLIGAEALLQMKRSAVLVNIARGYVVDSDALAAALRAGTIAGAGLDVTDPEPLPAGHPLWDAPNLIIAPHMAGASGPIMGQRLADVVGDNVGRWLRGEPLAHVITL